MWLEAHGFDPRKDFLKTITGGRMREGDRDTSLGAGGRVPPAQQNEPRGMADVQASFLLQNPAGRAMTERLNATEAISGANMDRYDSGSGLSTEDRPLSDVNAPPSRTRVTLSRQGIQLSPEDEVRAKALQEELAGMEPDDRVWRVAGSFGENNKEAIIAELDGYEGANLQEKIKAYQREHDIDVTGFLDGSTASSMRSNWRRRNNG